jgi:hypothetical protein
MTQELLHGPDVSVVLEQVSGEGMTEGVVTRGPSSLIAA